jgi:Ca2+-transporting ATPase
MVYGGTHIVRGKGAAVVVAIGAETEIGQIAALTQSTKKMSTPLEEKIAQFSRHVLAASFFVFTSVILIGLMRQLPFSTIFGIALTQVVSMVPEGLPVALTVALAIGMQRMAKRGAIIRRLDAVETLGSTTVICTDKTGTLTRNEMTVTELFLPSGRKIHVSGSGYSHHGEFLENNAKIEPARDECLTEFFTAAALCNDAKYTFNKESAAWKPIGDPTEVSLLMMILKGGINPEKLRSHFKKLGEIPFNSESKMMAVLVEREGVKTVYIKGAPESILRLCKSVRYGKSNRPLNDEMTRAIKKEEALMAANALRLLAFAIIEHPTVDLIRGWESLKDEVCYLGICGQYDPPRTEVENAVKDCLSAGIVPIIITGDHKISGLAVAKKLHIAHEGDIVLDGQELALLSDEELDSRLHLIPVFARVHPTQKLQIVKAWQRNKATVAMTGDGVNDAPALAKADVGVAMGITGTEVAKEAAKMVITDDNFATIVHAIKEGRIVHKNLKKMLLYLVSTNVTELFVLYATLIFGYPLPLAAVQILWINLVTDGVSQIPLIMEPSEGNEMKSPPIPRNEPLITSQLLKRMMFMTPAMVASTLFYFIFRLSSGIPFAQVQTGTFTVLAVCQWFNALNCRSETRSAFKGLFKNRNLLLGLFIGNVLHMGAVFLPPLNDILHTVPMPLSEVFIIGSVASLVLWVEELRKLWIRYKFPQ